MRNKSFLLIIMIIFFSCEGYINDLAEEFTQPTIICVNPDATGNETGKGWVDAYTSLYDAIANAKNGDEIWICGNFTTTDLDHQILINKDISIIGGFDVNDRFKNDRNPNKKSRLEGFFASGNLILITNASKVCFEDLNINNAEHNYGSVIINSNSSVYMYDCSFENDDANSFMGAAVYSTGDSKLFLFNCYFYDCSTSFNGGAVYSSGSSLVASNCSFTSNRASGSGGAIVISGATADISNSSFIGNTAAEDGGAIYSTSSEVNISNCKFSGNKSYDDGAAIYAQNESKIMISDNSLFEDNYADDIVNHAGDENGGAICILNSSLSVNDTGFISNKSKKYGGAIYTESSSALYLEVYNSTFTGNTAVTDGASIYTDAIFKYDNCTFDIPPVTY